MESEHKAWLFGVVAICAMLLGIVVAIGISNTAIAESTTKIAVECVKQSGKNWTVNPNNLNTFGCFSNGAPQ